MNEGHLPFAGRKEGVTQICIGKRLNLKHEVRPEKMGVICAKPAGVNKIKGRVKKCARISGKTVRREDCDARKWSKTGLYRGGAARCHRQHGRGLPQGAQGVRCFLLAGADGGAAFRRRAGRGFPVAPQGRRSFGKTGHLLDIQIHKWNRSAVSYPYLHNSPHSALWYCPCGICFIIPRADKNTKPIDILLLQR